MPPETDNAFDAAFEKTWATYGMHLHDPAPSPATSKAICKIFFCSGMRNVFAQIQQIERVIIDGT